MKTTEDQWLKAGQTALSIYDVIVDLMKSEGLSPRKARLFGCASLARVKGLKEAPLFIEALNTCLLHADGLASYEMLQIVNNKTAYLEENYAVNLGMPRFPMALMNLSESLQTGVDVWGVCNLSGWIVAYQNTSTLNRWEPSLFEGLRNKEHEAQGHLLRDIVGNPFRRLSLEQPWLTTDVKNLALAAYETSYEEGFLLKDDSLFVLSDALIDSARQCLVCRGQGRYREIVSFGFGYDPDLEWINSNAPYIPCKACDGTGSAAGPLVEHLRSGMPHCRGCHVVDLLLGKE